LDIDSEYDVIVIGAGPSGSNAARVAAEGGAKVLLVEKRQEIGVPKRCGEGLSLGGIRSMGLKPNPKWAVNKIRGVSVYSPNGDRVSLRYDKTIGYVIERKIFDKCLALEATKAGATVLAKTAATGLIIEDSVVKGVKLSGFGEEFQCTCKVVIAADGVEAKVARWAGIDATKRLSEVDAGFQYEMVVDLEESDMLELYFGTKIAPRGYVWIFPKGKDIANVGIGIGGKEIPTAKRYLEEFIQSHPNLKHGSIIEINAGGIPVGEAIKKLVCNGLMVIGDAAHQVNAIHGGGIKETSIAGKIAGRVAAEAVKSGDWSENKLMDYEREWKEKRGEVLHKIAKLRQNIEKLSDEDLNMLAENLTGKDLVEIASGKGFMKLARIMMKKPSLIPLAKNLL